MALKRVVVTGIGALTPIGNNAAAYKHGLLNGVNGAGPITRFDASLFKTKFACEIKNFDPLAFMDRKEARKVDAFVHYAMVSSDEAIADAGINPDNVNPHRVGVIFSSGIGFRHLVGRAFQLWTRRWNTTFQSFLYSKSHY